MKKFAVVALAALAFSAPAFAGFVAGTGPDAVVNNDTAPLGIANVGDSFDVLQGSFSSYVATPDAPQITGGDLAKYGYTLHGDVLSVVSGVVTYGGSYRLFYDVNNDNSYTSGIDFSVSSGNASFAANFNGGGGNATVAGFLTQTAGPDNAAFADFGSLFGSVALNGTYNASAGLISGTLAAAPVPLPAAAMSGSALLGALALGRRRK